MSVTNVSNTAWRLYHNHDLQILSISDGNHGDVVIRYVSNDDQSAQPFEMRLNNIEIQSGVDHGVGIDYALTFYDGSAHSYLTTNRILLDLPTGLEVAALAEHLVFPADSTHTDIYTNSTFIAWLEGSAILVGHETYTQSLIGTSWKPKETDYSTTLSTFYGQETVNALGGFRIYYTGNLGGTQPVTWGSASGRFTEGGGNFTDVDGTQKDIAVVLKTSSNGDAGAISTDGYYVAGQDSSVFRWVEITSIDFLGSNTAQNNYTDNYLISWLEDNANRAASEHSLRNTKWTPDTTITYFVNGQSSPTASGKVTYSFSDGTTAGLTTFLLPYAEIEGVQIAFRDSNLGYGFGVDRKVYTLSPFAYTGKSLSQIAFGGDSSYAFYEDENLNAWVRQTFVYVPMRFRQLCRGAIISGTLSNSGNPHFEQLIPVDTDEPTSYVGRWDVSRTENDSVKAYLLRTAVNGIYHLHFYGYGATANYGIVNGVSSAPYASFINAIREVVFHDGITDIGQGCLLATNSGTFMKIVLSDTVRVLQRYAFERAYTDDITLGAGLRRIHEASIGVRSSPTISFPASLAIADYIAITSYDYPGYTWGYGWLNNHTSSGGYLVVGDGVLLWGKPTGTVWTIPEGIKSVACYRWNNYANVTRINLPSTTKYITTFAFGDFTSIAKFKIPQGTEYISNMAFARMAGLRKIWIPRSVTKISTSSIGTTTGTVSDLNFIFTNCTSLTIYCEIDSSEVPDEWSEYWNYTASGTPASVVWNYPEPDLDNW